MSSYSSLIMAATVAAVPSTAKVYQTIVQGIPPSLYVVLHIPDESREATAVDAVSDAIHVPFHVISVASSDYPGYARDECIDLARRVRVALTDLVIAPDGMNPARIQHEGSNLPQPDEGTPDKKVFTQAQFSFHSIAI